MNLLSKVCITVWGVATIAAFTVNTAMAEPVRQPDNINIVSTDTKDIGFVIRNRNITKIEYTVELSGYYLTCISITIHADDGGKLSHMYNECTSHLNGK